MYIVIRVEVWKLGLSLKKLGFGPPQLGLVDHIRGYVYWEFQPNIQVGWSYIHMETMTYYSGEKETAKKKLRLHDDNDVDSAFRVSVRASFEHF